MADKLNQSYLTLITNAITDFDNIYKALQAKSVSVEGTKLTDAMMTDGSVPTADYAGLIGQLYRVEGVGDTGAGEVSDVNGVIANKSGITQAATNSGIVYGENHAITVTGTVPTAGYYSSTSKLTNAFTGAQISLTGKTLASGTAYTVEQPSEGVDYYKITPNDGSIISEVRVDQGKATVNVTNSNITESLSARSSIGTLGGTADNAKLLAQNGAVDTQGQYSITFDISSYYSGSIKATSGTTLDKEGYISNLTVLSPEATKTIAESLDPTVNKATIVIPKAGISGITASGQASVSIPSDIAQFTGNEQGFNANDYYKLTASGTVSINTTDAKVTSGYIKQGDSIGVNADNSGITSSETYIRKGKIGTAAENAATVNITLPSLSYDTTSGKYTTTASVEQTYSKGITSGYVTSETFSANLTGSETLSVNPASVSATASTSATGEGASIFNTTSGAYAYTFTGTTTISSDFDAGYLGSADEINIPTSSSASKTIYVNAGSVSASTSLSATAKAGSAGNDGYEEATKDESKVNIFIDKEEDLDKTRDYYEISATPTATVTPGYIVEGGAGATVKKYLPKATVKYVEDSTGAGSFIEVEKGGYLPSGLIANISDISGKIDYAAVEVGFNTNFGNDVSGAYTITASKAQTTNAGYISGTAGQGTVSGSIEVAHGSAVINCTGDNLTFEGDPTRVPASGNTPAQYTFHADGSHTTTLTLVPGYTKIADITSSSELTKDGNVATISKDIDADLTLNAAAITNTSKITLGSASGTNVKTQADPSGYYVVPTVLSTGNKINPTVSRAGYLSSQDSLELTIENVGTERIYIQPGTQLNNIANVTAVAHTPRLDKTSGFKVVCPAANIAVKGTLAEGYYAGDLLEVSGTASLAEAELALNTAAITVSEATGYATLSSTQVQLYTEDETKATENKTKTYAILTATGTASMTADVTQEGYIDDESQITVGAISITENSKYVEVFVNDVQGDGEDAVNTITVGGQDLELNNQVQTQVMTAGKYVNKNTVVKLHADAMGVNVEAKLKQLENRLAGLAIA